MMIAEICFTCRRDIVIAARTHQLRPGWRHIWVVDEKDGEITAPDGVEVWRSNFPRKGNLNGWACLDGMAACFERAVADGATAIVKRDSDTRVLLPEVLLDFSEAVLAVGAYQQGCASDGQPWRMFGCCYALAAEAVRIIRAGVATRDHPSANPPEDAVFSWFLRGVSRVHPWTAIRFRRNRDNPPGIQFAENIGNLWIIPTESSGRRVRYAG